MRLLWRAELRRGWRGLLTIALIVALVGSVVLAALAGARRTSTAFDRFLRESRNPDVTVFAQDVRPADVARIRALPGVDAVGVVRPLSVLHEGEFIASGAALDDAVLHDIARPRIVAGRAVRAGATDEVVIGEALAKRLRMGIGDTLELQSFTQAQIDAIVASGSDSPAPEGPDLDLRVVGISRTPVDLSLQGSDGGVLLMNRAIATKYGDEIGGYFAGGNGAVVFARLGDGSDGVAGFLRRLRTVLDPGSFDVDPAALTNGGVQESIDLLALAVLVLGLCAGVAGLIALGLIVGRQIASTAARQRPIRDLGVTRPRRALAAGGPTAAAAGIGIVGAVIGAWLASGLFPFGVGRAAEPHPGLAVDAGALGLGALALAGVLAAAVAIASWRSVRVTTRVPRGRPTALTRVLDSRRLSPSATIGLRLALDPGRGTAAVPVRSSLLATGFAVFGVVAVAVFGASLAGLSGDARAFGRPWDVTVADLRASTSSGRVCGPVASRVPDDRDVVAAASVCNLNATVDGRSLGAYAITSIRGSVEPTVLRGRAPQGPREIALGSETLRKLGKDVGDRVVGRTPAGHHRYLVVGEVVVPSLRDPQAVGDGAVFTARGLNDLDAPDDTLGTSTLAVRFRADADHGSAIARIRRMPGIGAPYDPGVVVGATPLEVDRLGQIDRVPTILAMFLAVVGTIAIAHLLVTSGSRRRRDFAVLKAMGFTRRQLGRAVAWQATTVAAIGCVVGVVAGVAVGALLWRAVADRVGVLAVVDPAVPFLLVSVAATFVVANVAAIVPARAAGRVEPAAVLRDE